MCENERESNVTNQKALFYDWFLEHHASTVKDIMLSNIRRLAGLGNPPSPYYTNAVESMNSVLKLRTDFKKQKVTAFVHKLRELVDNQFAEIDRAVETIRYMKTTNSLVSRLLNGFQCQKISGKGL